MAGPLARVDTIVGAVNLDVSRILYWGNGITLEFIVPDVSTPGNWQVVKTLTKGFDRATSQERTAGDSSDVFFEVADLAGDLLTVLANDDLFIRIDGDIFKVADTPGLARNEGQIFKIHCKTRALRARYTTTVKR